MKLKSSVFNLLVTLIAISPLAFLAIIYNKLPQIVAVHYDVNFTPDKMDNKNTLWIITGTLCFVAIFIHLLLLNLHRFDPKRRAHGPSVTFKKIATVVVIFLTIINFLVLLGVNNSIKLSQKLLLIMAGLLIAFIGNYMNNIKPNYFAGIRLPWTLSSDDNWRRTHHLASKIWFWGGVAVAVCVALLPGTYSLKFFFASLSIMVIIPVIYSYSIFKQQKL